MPLSFVSLGFWPTCASRALVLGACLAGPVWAQSPSAPAAPPAAAAPAAEADPRFDILEFLVEGNTVLPSPEIERAVLPYLGEKRAIADVERARKALEEVYQRMGYQTVFVDVPEQKIADGVVRLRVLEGRVERLRISGNRYFTQGEIRTRVQDFAPGAVPDFNAVQTQLSALNRTGDRQVTPVLRAGRTPGTVEVELMVKDALPLHGEVEINNRGSAFTTSSRLSAGLRWDNLWQQQHSAGLSVQMSPQKTDEVRVLVGNYLWRMSERPDVLALYAVKSDSRVAVVGSSTVIGDAIIAGARWVKPLPSGTSQAGVFHSLTFGADYKNFGETDFNFVDPFGLPFQGAIAYVPLSLAYGLTLAQPGRVSQFSITALTAPRGVLGNHDHEFQGRRQLGRAGWASIKFDATHERAFGARFGLWGKLDGQWTDVPLIATEQWSLGGAESVRGYHESELSGDRGGRASVELRWWPWRLSAEELQGRAKGAAREAAAKSVPSAAPGGSAALTPLSSAPDWRASVQFYGLLDIGAVEVVQPAGPQFRRRWIGGAGLGLRASAPGGWRVQFEGARALNPGGTSLNGFITEKGDWHWHARLGLDF